MIAYKFLPGGGVAPFRGVTGPAGGDYCVAAEGPLAACRNGVHGCRVRDLPYWLDDELWEIELDGEVIEDELKLVARRGRLVSAVEAWDDEARRSFAERCLLRVAKHAADELRDAGLDTEAAALEAAEATDDVAAAAGFAVEAARAAGAANAERLASYAADAVDWTKALPPSGVAYVAAHAADSRSRSDAPDAFAAERALQAQWLAESLGLSPDAA